MAQWTQAYVDSLPDSSFLYVSPDGSKDSDNKTTPRSLRHLPYKDADGNIDHDHLANAAARLDQTQGIPADGKEKIRTRIQKLLGEDSTKMDRNGLGVFRVTSVKLDANGELPTRIPLFVTGKWPNSVKGNFKVTLDDLKEMKQHHDEGIGFPTDDHTTGLAIDFEHKYDGKAAAWIKGLELDANETTGEGTLYANPVEWTPSGEEAVRGGEYKCVSPMGAFGSKNGKKTLWAKANDLTKRLSNVIEGAGLTNIPFLQGMSPIRAAALADDDQEFSGMIFVKDKENDSMNLDALRLKENKDVTAEERAFLAENKDKLSAEELKNFELETTVDTLSKDDQELLAAVKSGKKKVVDADKDNNGDQMSDEDKKMMEDIKSGKKKVVDVDDKLSALTTEDRETLNAIQSGDKKLVDKDTLSKLDKLDKLEAIAEEYEHNKAKQIVLSHIERGAVKQDQEESTVNMLLSSQGDGRKAFEDHLSALPSNELLAHEIGHDQAVESDVLSELNTKTKDLLSKAKESGELLTWGQAQERLMRQDTDLKSRYDAHKSGK